MYTYENVQFTLQCICVIYVYTLHNMHLYHNAYLIIFVLFCFNILVQTLVFKFIRHFQFMRTIKFLIITLISIYIYIYIYI